MKKLAASVFILGDVYIVVHFELSALLIDLGLPRLDLLESEVSQVA